MEFLTHRIRHIRHIRHMRHSRRICPTSPTRGIRLTILAIPPTASVADAPVTAIRTPHRFDRPPDFRNFAPW